MVVVSKYGLSVQGFSKLFKRFLQLAKIPQTVHKFLLSHLLSTHETRSPLQSLYSRTYSDIVKYLLLHIPSGLWTLPQKHPQESTQWLSRHENHASWSLFLMDFDSAWAAACQWKTFTDRVALSFVPGLVSGISCSWSLRSQLETNDFEIALRRGICDFPQAQL